MRLTSKCYYFLALVFICTSMLAGNPSTALANEYSADKIPVIAYHEVLPFVNTSDASNPSVISLAQFSQQMEYLYKNGYYTASISELGEFVKGKKKLPPRTVVITFDDGYESNYLYCYPYLLKYNFRASIFLMGKVPQEARPHLSGFQIMSMIRSGLVEIGCHTYDLHREIDGKPALEVLPEPLIQADFARLNLLLQRIGIRRVQAIAYPYGANSAAATGAALSAGYRIGFTIDEGYVRPGDSIMALKRFNIGPDVDLNKFTEIITGTIRQSP
ncbi:MAG: polysaccharide deacetylase family protein [Bacillota bacterium]